MVWAANKHKPDTKNQHPPTTLEDTAKYHLMNGDHKALNRATVDDRNPAWSYVVRFVP